jgi:hypothetical protein
MHSARSASAGVHLKMAHLIINNATDVLVNSVGCKAEKVIRICVLTEGDWGSETNTISIYDLPTHVADALEELLGKGGVKPALDEAEIRADERRKITRQVMHITDLAF